MAQLDQESADLLARAPQIYSATQVLATDDVDAARRYTVAIMEEYEGKKSEGVSVSKFEVPSNSGSVPVRLYRAIDANEADDAPLVVFFHGGGWSVGDASSYEPFMRSLCARSGVAMLSADFRRAPEHKYPAAHDDCYDVLEWAFTNCAAIGIDNQRIAVMGDSAGAHMAVLAAMRLHSSTEFRLRAQYLVYPFLDLRDKHDRYPSRIKFGNGEYFIGLDALVQSKDWYFGEGADGDDPYQSPILLPNLGILPPTVLAIAGYDPLADEGRCFADRLDQENVEVVFRNFEQTIHGFLPFGSLPIAREGRNWLAADIKERLGDSVR